RPIAPSARSPGTSATCSRTSATRSCGRPRVTTSPSVPSTSGARTGGNAPRRCRTTPASPTPPLPPPGRPPADHGTRPRRPGTADLEAADIPAPQVVAAARALVPDVARGIRSAPLTVEECAEAVREALGPARDTAAASLRLDTAAAGTDRSACTPASASFAGSETDRAEPVRGAVAVADDACRTVAEVRGITVGYQTISGARSTVIDDLDLRLHADERVALVGSNGAGKSTLLSTLAGMRL